MDDQDVTQVLPATEAVPERETLPDESRGLSIRRGAHECHGPTERRATRSRCTPEAQEKK